MTPEFANNVGRKVAARLAGLFCKEGDCENLVGCESFGPKDVVEAIEIHLMNESMPSRSAAIDAHVLRGAAAYWRDRAQDLEEIAAALEADQ